MYIMQMKDCIIQVWKAVWRTNVNIFNEQLTKRWFSTLGSGRVGSTLLHTASCLDLFSNNLSNIYKGEVTGHSGQLHNQKLLAFNS
jgi:hypothetical protein